jgi:pectate lyase
MKTIPLLFTSLILNLITFSQSADFTHSKTVQVGPTREYKFLSQYLMTEPSDVHILIDAGDYYSETEIWVSGNNIIVEGLGEVNLYCQTLYNNVMWVSGNNIIIKNLRMKHFKPGSPEDQNCTGRVLAFDNANNVTVENCNLNGCGLAGLHDNLGNSNILVKNCYIHNNSLGAYTDIDGRVWLYAVDDHPVFKFENNRIENNGPDRIKE